jgi:hypothetical protein
MVPSYTGALRGALALTIAATACGGVAATPPPADAPPVSVDAPGARCNPSLPFNAPIALSNLNTPLDDVCPRLSNDELDMVFSRRSSDGTYDLYEATRAQPTGQFNAPQILGTLNSIYNETWPTLTPDGLTVYFNSDRITPGTFRIFSSSRATKTAAFGPPTDVAAVMNNDLYPYITADGTAFYFTSSTRPDTAGQNDIYRASLDSTGTLGVPAVLVGDVNTAANEVTPAVTGDELTLYFCRDNATDCDIWSSTRTSATDPWGPPAPLANESSTGVEEVPGWISPDGCDLYIYSNIAGGIGGTDLYELVRPPA